MNQEVKQAWVEALRSGEYKQGQYRLTDGLHYCCLGVLCELAVEAGVVVKFVVTEGLVTYTSDVDSGDYEMHTLPAAVARWAGLDSHSKLVWVTEEHTLTELNDGEHSYVNERGDPLVFDFNRIADIIEEKL